ncbi:MAG: hypothetical protein ABW036_06085, partial [Flavitalea sp.]
SLKVVLSATVFVFNFDIPPVDPASFHIQLTFTYKILLMPANKKITDLMDYTSILPYASELFGIYQPLLGWKSKRIAGRFNKGFDNDKLSLLKRIQSQFLGQVDIKYKDDCQVDIQLKPGSLETGEMKMFDNMILEKISEKLPPYDQYKPEVWREVITRDHIEQIFQRVIVPTYQKYYIENCAGRGATRPLTHSVVNRADTETQKRVLQTTFERQLEHESALSGALLYLTEQNNHTELKNIFYTVINNKEKLATLIKAISAGNSQDAYLNIDNMNPRDQDHLRSVALSPISVVHLFRQYFFELDTFLGSPVSHVWMSPGSTVELIEVQTRKTITEKILENTLESVTKAEKSVTEQDEISAAVKEDNKQDIKFGASVTASYAGVTATSNFDYNNSQQTAREETHKRMRQQTEKLSTEIRKNFKSTFKTITEVTDTSSKRYVLSNSTNELLNYELRRKMRQVGVQVQDIGTYLCWQTYVDDPGEDLGVAKLIHLAKPADLDGIPHPEEIKMPGAENNSTTYSIPFHQTSEDDGDKDEGYRDGVEVDEDTFDGDAETIQADFTVDGLTPPKSGYRLVNVDVDTQGQSLELSRGKILDADNVENGEKPPYKFNIHLDYANFQGKDAMTVKVNMHWEPTAALIASVTAENETKRKEFAAKEEIANRKVYVENAKERIKMASEIDARPAEELREEERIVVYRKLIQDMLTNGIAMPDDRTRHVVAELINAIFDVDKMLYFVSPEWWRPRLHRSVQQLEETSGRSLVAPAFNTLFPVSLQKGVLNKSYKVLGKVKTNKLSSSTVGWGGIQEQNRDNYYITNDSRVAKLGSSLGWLLQLDGDNMRNAFLNAPWVKAVMPIRPGKEEAAINWLKAVEGMNGIEDSDIYHTDNPDEKDINGNPLNGQKMIDVLMDLAKKIKQKHAEGIKIGKYPKQSEVADPILVDEDSTVTSTPIDRVYEHGFYPLQGGFKAKVENYYEICSQWIEVLPTDQVVPVEVKYDPKTGRQI